MERYFVSNILRDGNAETTLSKLAIQESTDEHIKELAHQMISDNLMISDSLYRGSLASICPTISQTPSRISNVVKKMKEVGGIEFDGIYLSEIQAYVLHDQTLISNARDFSYSPNFNTMALQMRHLADRRVHQITKIAETKNIVLQ